MRSPWDNCSFLFFFWSFSKKSNGTPKLQTLQWRKMLRTKNINQVMHLWTSQKNWEMPLADSEHGASECLRARKSWRTIFSNNHASVDVFLMIIIKNWRRFRDSWKIARTLKGNSSWEIFTEPMIMGGTVWWFRNQKNNNHYLRWKKNPVDHRKKLPTSTEFI